MVRAFRIVVAVASVVAIVAGIAGVVFGESGVLGTHVVTPNVDSELRFFSAWYVVAGVLLLLALPNVEREARTVRTVFAGFFLAGCGRAISMVTVGRPHGMYVVLMAIELALPLVVVPWHGRLARRSSAVASRGSRSGSTVVPRDSS
ncbi:MAG: DUF4345 domain-containing protein [Actinomycetota bacterium]